MVDVQELRKRLEAADWYVYDPEQGTDTFRERAKASQAASESLEHYRDAAPDGWHEGTGLIQWGVWIPFEQSEEVDRVETPGGDFDYRCDYAMKPHPLGVAFMGILDEVESLRAQVSNAQMALSLAGFGGDLLAQVGAALDAVEHARDAKAAADAHAEALRGRLREVEGRKAVLCPACSGSGANADYAARLRGEVCDDCDGVGAVLVSP